MGQESFKLNTRIKCDMFVDDGRKHGHLRKFKNEDTQMKKKKFRVG